MTSAITTLAPTIAPPKRPQRGRRKRGSASYSYVPDWAAAWNDSLPPDTLLFDIYARLSYNPLGELERIEDQIGDGQGVIQQRQVKIGMIHVDNSLSAWDKRVRRPGWERGVERMESGTSAGMVVYHQDRLLRQPRDLEKLIDLAEERDARILWVHGTRDLSNPDDRSVARIEVALACRQSDDTSRRRKRKLQGARERGRLMGGPRAFGWPGPDRTAKRGPDGKRPPVSAALVERERAAILSGSKDVALGVKSLRGVARQWNEEGLRTVTGELWIGPTVRPVLSRPRNAGLLVHKGEVIGKIVGEDPIITEDLFNEVMLVFKARARGRAPEGVYLASDMLDCSKCGNSMHGRRSSTFNLADGSRYCEYFCFKSRGGCNGTAIRIEGVDKILREFTIDRLSSPRYAARLAEEAARDTTRLAEVDRELGHISVVLKGLAGKIGTTFDYDMEEYEAARKPLAAKRARLTAEREKLSEATSEQARAQQLVTRKAEIAELWEHGSGEGSVLKERRALLARALRGHRVVIMPGTRGRADYQARVRILPAIGIGAEPLRPPAPQQHAA